MKNIITTIFVFLVAAAFCNSGYAQALDGTYTVTQGNTVTVQIGAAYVTTLNRATSVLANWSTSSSSISIQSKTNTTCTIKGVSPAEKVRLNYQCSYRYDGYSRSMNFYYEITVKSNVVSVTRVCVYPETATLDVGETLQLTKEIYPTNATNKNVYWTSKNKNIATVNSSGLVTAQGAGTVQIWADAAEGNGTADYCTVIVNEPTKVESISLDKTELNLSVGGEYTLIAEILPDDAYDKSLEWTSSDTEVVTVTGGSVKAIKTGECDITCHATDGSNISSKCHVIVSDAPQSWLTVMIPNGSFAVEMTGRNDVTLKVSPDEGFHIHSIVVNGEEIRNGNHSILTLTIPTIENTTVNVVFEKSDDISASDLISNEESSVKLLVFDGTVNIYNKPYDAFVDVFSLSGSLIKSTNATSIELPHKNVYIIKVADKSFKVAL